MGNYIPCIVKEGETGYYPTDWKWGTNLKDAKTLADNYNEKLGLTKEESYSLVLQSMKTQENEYDPDAIDICIMCHKNFAPGEDGNKLGFCLKCQNDPTFPYDLNAYYKAYDAGNVAFKGFETMSRGLLEPYLKQTIPHRKLTEKKRDRMIDMHASHPLTYRPNIDDPLIELGIVKIWDETGDAVELVWDVKIHAANGSISDEWYDWK